MLPRAVLLNSGIKPLYPARPKKTVYPKLTISSAKPRFSKQAQTIHKLFFNKTAGQNQQWKPKV